MSQPDPASRSSRLFFWLALPMVLIGFYAIDHQWDSSAYFQATAFDYDGTENLTVARQEGVNSGTTTARLSLALLGVIGLVVPCSTTLNFRQPLIWAVGGYFTWLYCTAMWSVDPAHTIYKLLVVGVFLLASLGLSKQLTLGQLTLVFTFSCLALLGIGLLSEIANGTLSLDRDYRFTGTAHPNTQALYGSVICLASTVWWAKERRLRVRYLAVSLFVVGVVALVASKSRTSTVAVMGALIAMGWLRSRGRQRWLLAMGGLSAITIGILLLALVVGLSPGKLRDFAAWGRDTGETHALTGRIPLWEELLHEYRKKPLLGYGYLAFWTPEQVDYLGDVFEWEIPHGHNMYIDVLLDGGIVALVLFLNMLLVALLTSVRVYGKRRQANIAFLFGMLCFALLHGCSESLFKMFTFPNFMLTTLMLRMAWKPTSARWQKLTAERESAPTAAEPVAAGP